MRIGSSVTSLSWIPQGAVEGVFRLPFELGVAHYDPPHPSGWGTWMSSRPRAASGSSTGSRSGSR